MTDPLPLLSKLFDGTLTEAEGAELREAIKTDPRFAEEVVFAASLHSGLRDLLAGQRELGGIPSEVSGLGDAHILPRRWRRRRRFLRSGRSRRSCRSCGLNRANCIRRGRR